MPTPTWQAPTSGSAPLANHVNQLLGSHQVQNIYTGTLQSSASGGSGSVTSTTTWNAQSFTTGASQTAIGYVTAQFFPSPATSNGSDLAPTTLYLYTNSAGAPGVPLISATVTAEYSNTTPANMAVPLPITGLSVSTQYWLVTPQVATGSFHWNWNKSSAVSGSSSSTNGTTWTAQAYGLRYQVFDQSLVMPQVATWEDSGARWTFTYYGTNGLPTQIGEYTAGQTARGYTQSLRTLSYTTGILTGAA